MTAAVLYGPEDVRIERIPVPTIGPGDALVRVAAATTCGTDAKVFMRGGHPTMIRPPAPFGHEFAGVIEAVGPEVRGFEPGMRVASANSAPCQRCRYCKMGRWSLCRDILYINGAYAEFIAVPERIVRQNLLRLPDHVPFAHACLVEPLACVAHGAAESDIRVGDTVVVNGAGPIGLFFVRLAALAGARVIATDLNQARLRTARDLGAAETVDASRCDDLPAAVRALTEGGEGADVAIDATGVNSVWEATIAMGRPGALVNLFGGCKPGTTISLDTRRLHYDEMTIKGVYHHTPHFVRKALDLIVSGAIRPEAFISYESPLEDVVAALRRILAQDGVKTAVIPSRR
jgi:L-iditol 2-dehydrogenase